MSDNSYVFLERAVRWRHDGGEKKNYENKVY